MERPASKMPWEENDEPDAGDDELLDDERSGEVSWLERPDRTFGFVSILLTPKDFLNPKLGDKWAQGLPHGRACRYFDDILERRLGREKDTMVLSDVQLLTGPGRRGPAPDVMVVRGARNPDPEIWRFDPVKQGAVPCLVVEVLSQTEAIRRVDQEDKVQLYQGLGIQDYLLVVPPVSRTGNRYRLQGYHLDQEGNYRPIEPDTWGRLLCAAVGLRFGVTAQGDRVEVFDARLGERLLSSREEEEGRKAAEAELERLRAEIRQLKSSGK